MLIYDIDNRGNVPIYEYLYTCIRDDIRTGRLKAGEKLPSKRELASGNGIALITVENAYAQLVMEGYAYACERKGYFVADIEIIDISKDNLVFDPSQEIYGKDNTLKLGTVEQTTDADKNLNQSSFPYNTWSKLMRRVLADREGDLSLAPASEGILELRRAIADYLFHVKNLSVNADNIIIGPGTEYLHSIILQLIGRNIFVAVEDPGYSKVGQIYESNGLKVMRIPMDSEGIDIDALSSSGARLVHTSPAHQFPTGVVMSAGRRHSLLAWASEQRAMIIEDDYDSEFRFRGRPMPPLMSLNQEQVIYMNTFTGTLAPSIRMAYMVLPDRLMSVYREKLSFLSGTVSTFEQLTLAAFISEGYYERHISRMKNKYRKLRTMYESVLECICREANKKLVWENDPAGLQMVLNAKGLDNSLKCETEGSRLSVKPMSMYCYYNENQYKGEYSDRYVIRIQDIEEADLRQELERLIDG